MQYHSQRYHGQYVDEVFQVKLNSDPYCDYQSEQVWAPFSESILAWDREFHQLMLQDQIRMGAYQRAIQQAVKPGMVVLDLGTGTGILGLWALQAGAKQLYAIDVNPDILAVAVQTFEQHGFSGQYQVFSGLSYDITLPDRVDLIISEIMGHLGDNEDFVPILSDARRRFLKASGSMLPLKVCSQLVPIGSAKIHEQVRSGHVKVTNKTYEIKDTLQRLALKSPFDIYYDVIIPQARYLSTPQVAQEFNMDDNDPSTYEIFLNFAVETEGIFSGFKGSFVAQLSDSVTLDISGWDIANCATSDSWKHCYLPIESPVEVKQGDQIFLSFSRSYPQHQDSPFRQCYSWVGSVQRQGQTIATFHQSMVNSPT